MKQYISPITEVVIINIEKNFVASGVEEGCLCYKCNNPHCSRNGNS